MRRVLWVLSGLASHWLRRPAQLIAMAAGLAAATALWSGVQALNAEARQSYDRAASLFASRSVTLGPAEGNYISQDLYVNLRRGGWPVSPILEGQVRMGGAPLRVLGVDLATMPSAAGMAGLGGGPDGAAAGAGADDLAAFMTPPWRTFAAPETLRDLGLAEGEAPRTDGGRSLPPLAGRAGVTPGVLLVDIGAAQQILDAPSRLTGLLLTGNPDAAAVPMALLGGERLRQLSQDDDGELERLTASFHLNLTAFGLLAFVVGLFIVYSAAGLAFEQRLPMMRTMRACGASRRALAAALLIETAALALAAGTVGLAAGYLIASALLPDVAATLRGLYGAPVAGGLTLRPEWWAAGLMMSLAGALIATGASLMRAWGLPVLAPAQPIAWMAAQHRWLVRQGALAAVLLIVALALWAFGEGLATGFVTMAALMLGAALGLPLALGAALRLGQRTARGPMAQWFWADARRDMSGLSLALMALLLALAANIGVGAMVGGFRLTFTGWLDQRFAADVYLNIADADRASDIADWLEKREDVAAVLPVGEAEIRLLGWPVEVEGFTDDPIYRQNWPLIGGGANWASVAGGQGALISEQLARRLRLETGAPIFLTTPEGVWEMRVAGIYADYGNPRGQARVALAGFEERFPEEPVTRFELRLAEGADASSLVGDMREAFGPGAGMMLDQRSIKRLSQSIFERTFAVTAALNALTLIVAGAALLTSLATLAVQRLPQLAPVWAVGATRGALARMELGKTLALAGITALLAIPLGIAVTWLLVAVINVEAFGWRLPLHVFPMQWARLIVLALLVALVAGAGPALRLARVQPARLARVFADER